MSVARNNLQAVYNGQDRSLNPQPRLERHPRARVLKMNQRHPDKAVGPQKQKKIKIKRPTKQILCAANAISQTPLEISPATALCLLLFDELSA